MSKDLYPKQPATEAIEGEVLGPEPSPLDTLLSIGSVCGISKSTMLPYILDRQYSKGNVYDQTSETASIEHKSESE